MELVCIHDLLIAGLTAANTVKISTCIFANGHAFDSEGAVHIAEVALVLVRCGLDAHDLPPSDSHNTTSSLSCRCAHVNL